MLCAARKALLVLHIAVGRPRVTSQCQLCLTAKLVFFPLLFDADSSTKAAAPAALAAASSSAACRCTTTTSQLRKRAVQQHAAV